MVLDSEDGRDWYYMQRREVGHRASHEEEESTARAKTLVGQEASAAIADAVSQDWLQGWSRIGSVQPAVMGAPALQSAHFCGVTDVTMKKVQQAYDAMNSVVIGLKKNLLDLRGWVDGATISAAMAVAVGAAEHISALQNVLFSSELEKLEEVEARQSLVDAATYYQTLKMKDRHNYTKNTSFESWSTLLVLLLLLPPGHYHYYFYHPYNSTPRKWRSPQSTRV